MVAVAERLPTPAEYAALRRAVGWAVPSLEACEQALDGSRAAVCAVADGTVVGMGRLVGDGGLYWFIVDVVVDPMHQGQGVGRRIIAALEAVAACEPLAGVVNLVAAPDVAGFYERLGYAATGSVVMGKRW